MVQYAYSSKLHTPEEIFLLQKRDQKRYYATHKDYRKTKNLARYYLKKEFMALAQLADLWI